ncbi:hypothetical protein EON65_40440, partial [archaeon]
MGMSLCKTIHIIFIHLIHIYQTDQPPEPGQPGHPPVFLSNVTRLQASVHPQYVDKWAFSNKDESDPDKSCFVRCHAKDWYSGSGG